MLITQQNRIETGQGEFKDCCVCALPYFPFTTEGQAWTENKLIGYVCPACLLQGPAYIAAKLRAQASHIHLKAQQKAMAAQQEQIHELRQEIAAEIALLRGHARDGVTMQKPVCAGNESW